MPRLSPLRRSTRLRRLGRSLSLALLLASMRGARADERATSPRLTLELRAPKGCTSADDIASAVERLVGERGAAGAAPLQVVAAVSLDEGGSYRLRLETPGGGSTRVRELHGPSCSAVTDAAALIIALMIDPSATLETSGNGGSRPDPDPSPTPAPTAAPTEVPAPTGAPSPELAPPRAPPTATSPAPAPPRAPTSAAPTRANQPREQRPSPRSTAAPITGRASISIGGDVGSLPAVAAFFRASGALVFGRQRVELSASVWPARASNVVGSTATGGDVDLFAGSAGTCRDLASGPLRLSPCVALELGRMHATGFGVTRPGSGAAPWFAASAGAVASWEAWSQIALTARVELVVPFVRPTFILEGPRDVHQPSAASGRASAGVEVRF